MSRHLREFDNRHSYDKVLYIEKSVSMIMTIPRRVLGYLFAVIFNTILILYFSVVPDVVRLFSIAAAIYYSFTVLYGIVLTLKTAVNVSSASLSESMTTFAIIAFKYLLPTVGFYILSNIIHIISFQLGDVFVIISIFLIGIVLIFSSAGLLAMAIVSLYLVIINR